MTENDITAPRKLIKNIFLMKNIPHALNFLSKRLSELP